VLQLADAFGLRNCAIWTPTPTNGVLQLAHQLVPPDNDAHHQVFDSTTISVADPDVAQVMSSKEGKVLRPGSALGMASGRDQPPAGAAAAIRLPILRVSKIFDQQSNNGNTSPDLMSYAILVLVLPPANTDGHPGSSVPAGGWSTQDLEVVQAVADQVAVALSHADALEESQLIRHKLAEQQAALLQAKREVASATKARNAAHAVMCDAMRRPTHPVVGLLSVMQQEAKLRPDQRLVVDALARTGALSSTLMDDIMESVSAADPPPLSSPCLLARRPFELRALVWNVASVAGCLSGCRGIGFSHGLEAGSSLPEWVVGDDRRVFHLLIHMVDALLSRCHQPHVAGRALSFSACRCNDIIGDDQHLIPPPGRRNFSSGGNHVFVKFQVGLTREKESGGPSKSLPASHRRPPRNRCSGRANTQLNNATCNKIAQVCINAFFCFIYLLTVHVLLAPLVTSADDEWQPVVGIRTRSRHWRKRNHDPCPAVPAAAIPQSTHARIKHIPNSSSIQLQRPEDPARGQRRREPGGDPEAPRTARLPGGARVVGPLLPEPAGERRGAVVPAGGP
jgi:ethylene receptor